MSLQKSKPIDNLSVVILCAGEGTRIKELASDIPKPLLKIKTLNNKTILHDTINNLISIGINKIVVVKGHLGHKIDEFINSLIKNNSDFKNVIKIVDSGTRYKLGPLYSFLSITKNEHIYKKNHIYLIIPGDTIFEFNLLNSILSIVIENVRIIKDNPFVLYKKVNTSSLKAKFKDKISRQISIVELEKKGKNHFLKSIAQKTLQELSESEYVDIIIPVFALSRTFINEIIELEEKMSVKTIKDVINLMIRSGKKIHAIKVTDEHEFYDIDEKLDILGLNIEKR